MKKTIVFCILAFAVIFIVGCKPAEVPTTPEEQPPAVPETTPAETPAEEAVDEVTEEVTPTELLSGAKCVGGEIQGTILNTGTETLDLTKAIVYINGIQRRSVDCDKMSLEAGESTFCSSLSSGVKLKASNKILVRLSSTLQMELTGITCE